jgi:LPXTG-site transpeptidase (sortase) family protein
MQENDRRGKGKGQQSEQRKQREQRRQKKKKMSAGMKFLFCLLLVVAVGLIASGVYLMFFKNRDAYERQNEERDLADTYIDDLILKLTDPEAYEKKVQEEAKQKAERMAKKKLQEKNQNDEESESGDGNGEEASSPTYDFSDLDYEDENYYMRDGVVYTPDYAKGTIQCVLEVPTAGIRRGVYTGTWDEINYDLDIWMVTAARPDYTLGETHFCIYGHNHTAQDLSFNRLKDVEVGDAFYLTAESGRYTYRVTNVFAVSREEATSNYVDNFTIGSDKCYIITCGRDDGVKNYRYLDLIVEGTLEEQMPLLEYAKIRQQAGQSK